MHISPVYSMVTIILNSYAAAWCEIVTHHIEDLHQSRYHHSDRFEPRVLSRNSRHCMNSWHLHSQIGHLE